MMVKIKNNLLHYFKDPKIINLQNKDIWLTQELTGAYSLWAKENEHFVRQYEIPADEPLCKIIDNFFFILRKIEIIDGTRGAPLELEVIK